MNNQRILQTSILILFFTLFTITPLFSQQGGRKGNGPGMHHGNHPGFFNQLTKEQQAELNELVMSFREEGKTREEIHEAVQAKFKEWGIEMPETPRGPGGPGAPFADLLTDEQHAELQALMTSLREEGKTRVEIHEAVQAQFKEWGIEMPEPPHGPGAPFANLLTDEQQTELQALMMSLREEGKTREEIHEAVQAKFDEWGIEMPEPPHGPGGPGAPFADLLTDEQQTELQALVTSLREEGKTSEEIREAVDAKLEEWGIEKPQPGNTPEKNPEASESDETSIQLSVRNFPNPFNPVTQIRFDLENAGNVSLKVYNIKGQLISTLVDGYRDAGSFTVQWDGQLENGSKAPSGTYFYRLQSGGETITERITLMK